MSISDRTRKILWGRSGNKCSICKRELVVNSTTHDDESIVGDECHIISGRTEGPRYDPTFPVDQLEQCENLILLCRTHHKMVDDQSATYTADILRQMKVNHENWVSEKLNPASDHPAIKIWRMKQNIPPFLNRLTTGKEVFNIVDGCCAGSFDHDELQSQEEVDLVGGFLETIQDWDVVGPDLSQRYQSQTAFELSQALKELEAAGFYVFGAREVQRIEGGELSPSAWPVAIIRVLRRSHPEIVTIPVENEGEDVPQ